MNVKTEPVLGAAACGVVVAIVYTVVDTILGYIQSPSSYTAFGQAGSCFITLFAGLLTGVVYALLHRREGVVTAGVAAKGGAAAGALALFIAGIFGVVVILLLLPDVIAEQFGAMGLSPDLANDVPLTELMGVAFFITMAGTACGFTFVGAMMGALGGVIGATIFGSAGASQPA